MIDIEWIYDDLDIKKYYLKKKIYIYINNLRYINLK